MRRKAETKCSSCRNYSSNLLGGSAVREDGRIERLVREELAQAARLDCGLKQQGLTLKGSGGSTLFEAVDSYLYSSVS